jgi:hypothetical protein
LRAGFYIDVAPLALGDGRKKAAVNAPQSRRCARFEDARQSRSVWSARGFSTAFGRETYDANYANCREGDFEFVVIREIRVNPLSHISSISRFIPLPMIPLTDHAVGNATGRAEIR